MREPSMTAPPASCVGLRVSPGKRKYARRTPHRAEVERGAPPGRGRGGGGAGGARGTRGPEPRRNWRERRGRIRRRRRRTVLPTLLRAQKTALPTRRRFPTRRGRNGTSPRG